jgi:hypothetical protein
LKAFDTSIVTDVKIQGFTRTQFIFPSLEFDPRRLQIAFITDNGQGIRGGGDTKPVAPVFNFHTEFLQSLRYVRIEKEDVVMKLQPCIATLQNVHCSRHGTQVNAFVRRAALDVRYIAFQGLLKKLPRPRAIGPGQDPGMDDIAQG